MPTEGVVPDATFCALLPEGVRLTGAVTATKTSEGDHFTLLRAVGSDTIGDVRALPQNENFVMSLARRCGLSVPDHRIIEDDKGVSGLRVARFDRLGEQRFPQEDVCQASGLYPASKYRMKTESVIALLADAAERGGGSGRLTIAELLRLTAYSYAIGNGDGMARTIRYTETIAESGRRRRPTTCCARRRTRHGTIRWR